MNSTDTKSYNVIFSGVVQGVGFRFTAVNLANRHNISGWVMNLPDGRVELQAQGIKGDLNNFLDDLKEEFKDYIKSVDVKEVSNNNPGNGFAVKHF